MTWSNRDELEYVIEGVLVTHNGYPDRHGITRCECGGSERDAFAEHIRDMLANAVQEAGFHLD